MQAIRNQKSAPEQAHTRLEDVQALDGHDPRSHVLDVPLLRLQHAPLTLHNNVKWLAPCATQRTRRRGANLLPLNHGPTAGADGLQLVINFLDARAHVIHIALLQLLQALMDE